MVRKLFPSFWISIVLLALPFSSAFVALAPQEKPQAIKSTPSAEAIEFFEKKIRPVLATQCYVCHSSASDPLQGGLYLDSKEGLLRGGKSGAPAVVPGKPEASLLVTALRHTNKDLKMPPGEPLPAEQVEAFVEWIRMGAPDPRTGAEIVETPAYNWEEARRHWAFQPVGNPRLPEIKDREWSANPIDLFIKQELDKRGLKPLGRASKQVLARRVAFDLTGLPPTLEVLQNFLADASPGALEKLVDRLLSTTQYGERYGRHWLDIVRYADTAGDASDYPVHEMYRYRNYVIESFAKDKPFDQFLREQLAGDLLPHRDAEDRKEKLVATGYISNARRFGQIDREFYLTIDDTLDNLGKATLGLSLACARCHDHKFDPIPAKDYYALYGIFQSTNYAFAGMEHQQYPKNYTPLNLQDLEKYCEAESRFVELADKVKKMGGEAAKKEATPEVKLALAEAREELEKLKRNYPNVPVAYGVLDGKPQNAKIHVKGDPKTEGPEVPRGFLEILGGQKLPPDHPGSGRDLLATWITDPKNPLTARVIVNRVWQWHFGKGIVASPNDFGVRGERPSHPELLDYLTTRFTEGGWSIKKLHKLILSSRSYQTASGHDANNAVKDARNKYYWRFDRRRLAAEEIRDTILWVSGRLDSSMGDAHPFPAKPVTGFTQHRPFVGDIAAHDTNRRSVYLMQQRIRRQPYLDVFDGPDTNGSTDVRPVSTTSLQALYLMNNAFVHEQADHLAVRVGMAYSDTTARLSYAYRLLFARPPAADETAWAREFLGQSRQELDQAGIPFDRRNRHAWASLMRVLLSSNEFFYVD
jgi:hypothetical protein